MGHLYWARPEGELTGSFRDDDDLAERSYDEQHILKRPRLSLRVAGRLGTVPYRTGPGQTTVRNHSVRSSSLGTTPTPVAAYRWNARRCDGVLNVRQHGWEDTLYDHADD
jgi:hypothetical protein